MDTEEHIEIQNSIHHGHDLNERQSYEYEARKDSYRGGVKGKLGGLIIGAVIGAIVGMAIAAVLPLASLGMVSVGFWATTAAFSAAGMLFGAHEFGDAGKMSGASASVGEKLGSKIADIKQDIAELKSAITGKKPPPAPRRKSHVVAGESEAPHSNKLIFWKVAGIGLAVGMAAGALLAAGNLVDPVLHTLGASAALAAEDSYATYAASMTAMGLFGASYGINRDIFWKILDKTDLLFKGIIGSPPAKSAVPALEVDHQPDKSRNDAIKTVVYEANDDYPKSDTYHRDKVLAAAQEALLRMDHTKQLPH